MSIYRADTENGCTRSGSQTGNVQWASPNCYAYSGGDNGCTVFDYDPSSYGAGFNAAGGGVFALQIAETGCATVTLPRAHYAARAD